MINRFTILLLASALFAPAVYAQKKGFTGQIGFLAARVFSSAKEPKAVAYEDYIAIGYNLNGRFGVRLQTDIAVHLFDHTSFRDYRLQGTLGLGAGYNVVATDYGTLEISALAGNTVNGNNFRYNYYDGGLKWAIGAKKERTRMFMGLGVRHYHSQRKNFDSRTSGYATFGFRFN